MSYNLVVKINEFKENAKDQDNSIVSEKNKIKSNNIEKTTEDKPINTEYKKFTIKNISVEMPLNELKEGTVKLKEFKVEKKLKMLRKRAKFLNILDRRKLINIIYLIRR